MLKKIAKIFIATALLVVMILFSLPFVVQLDDYRPLLEEELSQQVGRRIMLSDLTPHLLPLPALTATRVSILGNASQPGELFVEQMHATLDPLELLNGKLIITSIHLDGVATNQQFLNHTIRSSSSKRGSPPAETTKQLLTIKQISGSNVILRTHDSTRFGPYNFSLQLDQQHHFKWLHLSRMDKSLHARLTPDASGNIKLSVNAARWRLPVGPQLHFDNLTMQATLRKGEADISKADVSGYNGMLTTNGKLSWRDGWLYNGRVTTQAMQMAPVLAHFDINTIDGRFNSDLEIKLKGASIGKLFRNPVLEGPFRITNGVISKNNSKHVLLKFDELSANGHLIDSSLTTDKTVLKTAGGTLYGDTSLSWKEAWDIRGNANASKIDAEKFLSGFIDNRVVSGEFYATTKFHLKEHDGEALLDRPFIAGEFKLTNGTLYKADLEKASTNLSKKGSQGGETPFQDLSGRATIKDNHITIAGLDITSNSLTASGDININPADELEGEVTVALRKTASIISAPLKVSGTVSEPSLRLTNDAIIGGAIGTSVLGPGVGTAVGMKVGRIIKKIGDAMGSSENAPKADIVP